MARAVRCSLLTREIGPGSFPECKQPSAGFWLEDRDKKVLEPFDYGRKPLQEMIKETIKSLGAFRAAQKKFFANPSVHRARYEQEFDGAVEALSSRAIADAVDPLISSAIEEGHASTLMAAASVESLESRIKVLERRLGSDLGFSKGDMERFFKLAHSSLASARARNAPLEVPESSDALVARMRDVHEQVKLLYGSGEKWSRRDRRRIRGKVSRNAEQELYAIGALVANSQHAEDFHYSLALSLGVSAAGIPRRRELNRAEDLVAHEKALAA